MSSKRTTAFEALVKAHQETIDSYQQSVDQIQGVVDLDETETRTMSAMSQQDEQTDIRNNMQVQTENAIAELANVKGYENIEISGIQPGAFIETKDRIFFLGSSHRSIPFGKKDIIGISTAAPAYQELSGLAKGDHFTLGDTSYTIIDIY